MELPKTITSDHPPNLVDEGYIAEQEQEREQNLEEKGEVITKVFEYEKECDWDIWLSNKLKNLFTKET